MVLAKWRSESWRAKMTYHFMKFLTMSKFLLLLFFSILSSCKGPSVKVASDYSGWPIDVNRFISSLQTSTGSPIEIQEEFAHKLSPTAPSGCIFFIRSEADDSRKEVLKSACTAVTEGLTANGYKILSTDPTSDKTDYRFVFTGLSRNGSITLKGLTDKGGVQLIVCLLEDIPPQP